MGCCSIDMSCWMIDLVSRPDARPLTAKLLDIAVHSSTRGAGSTGAACRSPTTGCPVACERLEVFGDAVYLVRGDLSDHLVGDGVDDLDAQSLRLGVDREARVRRREGGV